eukprot:12074396-Karenia_brevis.AAC.1
MELGKWTMRKRQGLVPDFLAAVPEPPQAPADAADELFELKALHYGSSTYLASASRRCQAVERRAAALPGEQLTKVRRLDQQYCRTLEGETGPVERRLLSYGPVRGLVFSHWAEATEHVNLLLAGCAHCGAQRHWSSMRAREPIDAMGTLAWLLRRRWGLTAWRAAARL